MSQYHTRGCEKGVMAVGLKILCVVEQSLIHT